MGREEENINDAGNEEEITLEEALDGVDRIIGELSEDIPLEKSFALYKEGMELIKLCDEKLRGVEEQILIMNEEGGLNEFQ